MQATNSMPLVYPTPWHCRARSSPSAPLCDLQIAIKSPSHPVAPGLAMSADSVPLKGGIALSTARMKRIKEINENDFVAVVQPGVIPADLQAKAEAKGLVLTA